MECPCEGSGHSTGVTGERSTHPMPTTASVDAPLNAMDSTRAATPIGTTLRVLELSTDIGGAYCGWLLAKLGANVLISSVSDESKNG